MQNDMGDKLETWEELMRRTEYIIPSLVPLVLHKSRVHNHDIEAPAGLHPHICFKHKQTNCKATKDVHHTQKYGDYKLF